MEKEEVAVCVPTLNEAGSIDEVVEDIISEGYRVIVIDGGSTDGTKDIASEAGAKVIEQEYMGEKGAAVMESMDKIESEILVFIDGDNTYKTSDIDKICKPILEDNCDHVIGNRFYDMKDGAMSTHHKIGNRMINIFFFVLFGRYLKDILSGLRAVRCSSFDETIKSTDFDIESEITAFSIKNGHDLSVVGISYFPRTGDSKLNGLSDGFKIIYRLIECRIRYLI